MSQAHAAARAEILARHRELQRALGCSAADAAAHLIRLRTQGDIELTPAALQTRLSISTLMLWHAAANRGDSLVPRWGNRDRDGLIDRHQKWRELVVAAIKDKPHANSRLLLDALRRRFGRIELSRRALQRWVARWRRENERDLMALRNPDKWRQRYQVALGSASAEISHPNQRWEIDGTPGDVMLVDGRHHVLGIIDCYSRRTRWLVAQSESADAATRLIRRAIIDWGIPEVIAGDNGSGFVSQRAQLFVSHLQIAYFAEPPFAPEKKPFIERAIGTMNHDLMERLPGYIGHDVAGRKDIEARRSFARRFGADPRRLFEVRLTALGLQEELDRWTSIYEERPHGGLAGRSPAEAAASYRYAPGELRTIGDPRALDRLLGEGVLRRVGTKGISYERAHFIDLELVNLIGESVLVYPAEDMGEIYCYSADGARFICIARNADRMGLERRELAVRAKQIQRVRVAALRREARREKARVQPHLVIESIPAVAPSPWSVRGDRKKGQDAGLRLVANGTDGAVEYETPALRAAGQAVRAADAAAREMAAATPASKSRAWWPDPEQLHELWRAISEERAHPEWAADYFRRAGMSAAEFSAHWPTTDDYAIQRRLERMAAGAA